jgi:hypothetical protein
VVGVVSIIIIMLGYMSRGGKKEGERELYHPEAEGKEDSEKSSCVGEAGCCTS